MDWFVFHLLNNVAGRNSVVDWVVVDWAKCGPAILAAIVLLAWVLLPGNGDNLMPRRLAILALAAAIVALGTSQIIGHEWFRERPYLAGSAHLLVPPSPDPSFPSDHAVGGFALATPLLFERRARAFGYALLSGATLLALSRVVVGTHYPSDILAGAALGAAVGVGMLGASQLVDRFCPVLWWPARSVSMLTDRVFALLGRNRQRTLQSASLRNGE